MKINTQHCKEAIVKFVLDNPGYVSNQFVPPENEDSAKKPSNWKRICKTVEKQNNNKLFVRVFDCGPYDDQLRATVWDDGKKILRVLIEGE